MKKITLALTALLTASAAFAGPLSLGTSYILVPADADTQIAKGKYLSAATDGTVTYSNELSSATLWEYNGFQDESWTMCTYIKNGDKYLTFGDQEAATLTAEETYIYSTTNIVDGAISFFNNAQFGFPVEGTSSYLNAANLMGEPVNGEACAFYAITATAETTAAEVDAALFQKRYPNAKVITCAGYSARQGGYFATINEEGKLVHTNTFDMNAVWNVITNTNGNTLLYNIGKGGYAYTSDFKLSEEPVELRMVAARDIYGAYAFTTDLDKTGYEGQWLNALGEVTTFSTWWDCDEGSSFFLLPYTAATTVDDYKAETDQLYTDGKQKQNALKAVNIPMNASSYGRAYGASYINAIKNASSAEEIEAAKNEALKAAVDFAVQNMTDGFGLFNTKSQQFVGAVVEDKASPVQRMEKPNDASLWIAQWLDTTGDAKQFKLVNVTLEEYVGQYQPYGSMPLTENAENAQVFTLEQGEGGFALKMSDGLYVSACNDNDMKISTWIDVNDPNCNFSFLNLEMMDQEEAYLDFGGEYTEDPMMFGKIYTSINSVEIIVPKNAYATGIGTVVFGTPMDEFDIAGEINELHSWTGAQIAQLKPTEKEITTEVYDEEKDEYVPVTSTVNVVSLPLDPAWDYPATYVVKASPYLFMTTIDGTTTYTGQMFNTVTIDEPEAPMEPGEVPVTPAAGQVEAITEITIGVSQTGYDYPWYTNPEAFGENVTVKFNGEITTDANGNLLDIDPEMMDRTYYVWDTSNGKDGQYIPVNFTKAGKYELHIPEAFFTSSDATMYNVEQTVEWTILEKDGILEIGSVKVNGEEIYDLQGRKVTKAAKGLYIINGKKVVK